MELEELKAAWQTANDRLDGMESAQKRVLKSIQDERTRTAAAGLRREPVFELVVAGLALLWTGNFLATNFSKILADPVAAVPAGLVHVLAIVTIGLSVRQLMMVSNLDYSRPIVEAQAKIAAVRALRVRSTQSMILIGLGLWVVFPMAAGQALFGLNFVHSVNALWVMANLAFGLLTGTAFVIVAKRFKGRSAFLASIDNLMAGTEIARAQKLLVEAEAFGQ